MTKACLNQVAKEVSLCFTTTRCPIDCELVSYQFNAQTFRFSNESLESKPWNRNRIVVKFFRDPNGDVINTHLPVISFSQVLFNLFAFITFSTGVSVMAISNFITNRIFSSRVKSKRQVADEEVNHQQVSHVTNGRWKSWHKDDCMEKSSCLSSYLSGSLGHKIPWKKMSKGENFIKVTDEGKHEEK